MCYVGETGRPLKTRLKEHRSDVDQATTGRHFTRSARAQSKADWHKSAISDHVCQQNCHIDWDNTQVVDHESNRQPRIIRESIHVATNDTMNRDQGAYQLPPIYLPLLEGAVKSGKTNSRLRKMPGMASKRF